MSGGQGEEAEARVSLGPLVVGVLKSHHHGHCNQGQEVPSQ